VKVGSVEVAVWENRDEKKGMRHSVTLQRTREEAEIWMRSRSQIATLKRGQNVKYHPYAFTEHGAIMAANVLKSRLAIQMSVFVVRLFIKIREMAIAHQELSFSFSARGQR